MEDPERGHVAGTSPHQSLLLQTQGFPVSPEAPPGTPGGGTVSTVGTRAKRNLGPEGA